MATAPPRQPSGKSPSSPPDTGTGEPNDLDAMRAALNKSLQEKRYDDAVAVARSLRDLLKSKPRLNPRELKSLAGAESVLRRFAEEGSTDVSGARRMKLAWAIGTTVVVLAILAYAAFHRYGPDPNTQLANAALAALDTIDAAVSQPIVLGEYQRLMRKERPAVEAYLSTLKNQRKGDVGYAGVASALGAYDWVNAEWVKSPASTQRLSTLDVAPTVPFPRVWRAAHEMKTLAMRVLRGEPAPQPPLDPTHPLAKLAGHWSDGTLDLYYGPVDPTSGLGLFFLCQTRAGKIEIGAFEAAPPPKIDLDDPSTYTRPKSTPSPGEGSTEVRVIQYMPRAATVVLKVSPGHISAGTIQGVRLDDKMVPDSATMPPSAP